MPATGICLKIITMVNKKNIITIWPDADMLAAAIAHLIVTESKKAILQKGYFTIALSGGNTPAVLYQLLATETFSKNIDWKKVFIFFSDERFVPHSSNESNYKMADDILLSKIPIPKKNISGIKTENISPLKSAIAYEKEVKKYVNASKPFNFILLGIGDEGHTASLFPNSPLLKEKRKLVSGIYVEDKSMWRITFTLPLINKAKNVAFLVAGTSKKEIVKTVLTGKGKKLPASLVQPVGNLYWFLDKEAAVLL